MVRTQSGHLGWDATLTLNSLSFMLFVLCARFYSVLVFTLIIHVRYLTLLHYVFHNVISVISQRTTDDGWCFIRNMSWLKMNFKNIVWFIKA